MDLELIKGVNEEILFKATEKIGSSLERGSWDKESFEVMAQSLDNILDIEKIEKYKGEEKHEEEKASILKRKMDAKTETTEFEQLIYDIAEKHEGEETMYMITTVLADHMEDVRLLYKNAYSKIMNRLKELL